MAVDFLPFVVARHALRDANTTVAGAGAMLPEVVMMVLPHLDVEREISKSTGVRLSEDFWTLAVRS
jgi:phage tail protein X